MRTLYELQQYVGVLFDIAGLETDSIPPPLAVVVKHIETCGFE
ncbi:MAG: hypothetical protein PF508_09315 [Spirochaeta sp.]|jgi:hypothetical protein|nr:hypothetical protein [Spirochaeta sp.]